MRARDTIVEYKSVEGEHIKVVSGPVFKRECLDIEDDRDELYMVFSTRARVRGIGEQEYSSDELKLDWSPLVRRRIEDLAESQAPLDELLSAIDTQIEVLRNNEDIETDDPERFKEFE